MTAPEPPDNNEQKPGGWGSNRFIVVLAGIIIGVIVVNFISNWGGNVADGQLQTPSGTSKNQPADSPQPR